MVIAYRIDIDFDIARQIDATFDVWVLPSSRSDPMELPEIGSGDPSVRTIVYNIILYILREN